MILNAAEAVGVTYTEALGFFTGVDYGLIVDGTYGPEQVRHALRYGVKERQP